MKSKQQQAMLARCSKTDPSDHRANPKSSFEYARKLMQAKDIGEVMQLQSDFMRNQFGVATEQF
jgi:hypothetical protein